MVLQSLTLEKSVQPQRQGYADETVFKEVRIGQPAAMKNIVTVYNMETFEIGKIRVNRVITVRSLIQKIAAHYEIKEIGDLVIRFGDLNLVFDANSSESDLDKRLFQDLDFIETNLIGV